MFEQAVDEKRLEIAQQMANLGRKLEAGVDSELLLWVIRDKLACAHRPLRHHPAYGGSGASIPSSAKPLVVDWIDWLSLNEIASIISFMHERDLKSYRDIDFDGATLTTVLELRGFEVCPLPWEDPHHKKTDPAVKQAKVKEMRVKALHAFDHMPKPVVLVCSAGIDRSAPVAAFIFETLRARNVS